MITRAQVADLQPGDVVRLECNEHPGTVITGPLHVVGNRLQVGTYILRTEEGRQFFPFEEERTLTVVSRAPRPLYVNHDRTEPVPGDVVRQEGSPLDHTWHYLGRDDSPARWWRFDDTGVPFDKGAPLRLLVDGATGQVVP